MVNVQTAVKSFKLGSVIYRYWWLIITLIIVVPSLIDYYQEGKQAGDYSITITKSFNLFTSADKNLYENFKDFKFEKKESDSLSEKIDYYASLVWEVGKKAFVDLWMIVFLFFIIFTGVKFLVGNKDADLGAFLITIVILGIIQALTGKIPLRGVYTMIKTVGGLI
jgi:hypothetical protein